MKQSYQISHNLKACQTLRFYLEILNAAHHLLYLHITHEKIKNKNKNEEENVRHI